MGRISLSDERDLAKQQIFFKIARVGPQAERGSPGTQGGDEPG
jgi:hypothetical protein